MIRNNTTRDFSAWALLGLLLLPIGMLLGKNHDIFMYYPVGKMLGFIVAFALLTVCAGVLRRAFPRAADVLFAVGVAVYLYRIWPHMFFDDAGFIMRYLDQLEHGYWFQYNPGEGAVFGISGFIHGLYCSLLVKITGMSAERALHISNLTGLVLTTYFLSGIFRYFLTRPGLAYAATFIVVCFSKSWADVLFTGMETPLHVALVIGSFYFLLNQRIRRFYFFAALSVISKLDAVPVMAVLLLFHAIDRIRRYGIRGTFILDVRPQLLYFWLPLALWVVFSYWLFGGPFPQSAKAKLLYHSGANESLFPFLEGFTNDLYKWGMLCLLGALFLCHLLFVKRKGIWALTHCFGFGWMYVALMALYYFYNPNERMLWYYALPELLLVAQCVLSTLWMASETKDWKRYVLPGLVLLYWVLYLKPDVDGGRHWMFSYLERVERERYEVGKYIAKSADKADTLLAWHGLIARPFPGFVLDGTGLNSKMAVDFKLNRDSMISVVKPDFGVHHGYPHINASFSQNGYHIKGMFGDVTLENWPAWIWWEKGDDQDMHTSTRVITDSMVVNGKITYRQNPLKIEGRSVMIGLPAEPDSGVFWAVFEGRGSIDKKIKAKIWANGQVLDEYDIDIPPYGKEGYPSLFTVGASVPYGHHRSDSTYRMHIEFLPTGADTVVKINNPIIAYPK